MTPLALRPTGRLQPSRPAPSADFAFLEKRFTPRTVFMDLDCTFALRAAGYVERVYAVDLTGRLRHEGPVPCNLRIVICDGTQIPVPEASVHLAWSAASVDPHRLDEHLKAVRRSLAPGGEYFFISGNPQAHRLREAGFSSVWCWLGAARMPWAARALLPQRRLRFSAIA